jgi:hypothetical protein
LSILPAKSASSSDLHPPDHRTFGLRQIMVRILFSFGLRSGETIWNGGTSAVEWVCYVCKYMITKDRWNWITPQRLFFGLIEVEKRSHQAR